MKKVVLPILLLGLAAGLSAADIVRDIVGFAPERPHSYDQFMAAVEQLAASPRISAENIGFSRKGRPLVLLAVHAPDLPSLDPDDWPPCLFVIARQHGTESSGTEAALALLRYFATTEDETSRAILRQLTIAAVPMANPDGVAASRRSNAADVDLNRDWGSLSQPETRAIADAVARWQPLAIIDLHELPGSSAKPAFAQSFIQTIGRDGKIPPSTSEDCGICSLRLAQWMRTYSFPANLYYDYSHESSALCHRYFGLTRSIPAYLFEAKTGPGHSLAERVTFHVLGALVVGNYLIHTYYDSNRPTGVAVAEAPPTDQQPTEPPPAEVPPLALEILKPTDGTVAGGEIPVVVQTQGEGFSYVTFHVDGMIRALTTAFPYTFVLDASDYADGQHRIDVALCNDIGRPLLSKQCTITINNDAQRGE